MSSQNLIFKLLILIDREDRLTGMLCYENIVIMETDNAWLNSILIEKQVL